MKLRTSHAIAGITLAILAVLMELPGAADPTSMPQAARDPSVPAAGPALAGVAQAGGNVQDLTY
jgi:hypothetical protein